MLKRLLLVLVTFLSKVTRYVTHRMKAENVTILKTNFVGSKRAGMYVYGRFSHDVPIISYIYVICSM